MDDRISHFAAAADCLRTRQRESGRVAARTEPRARWPERWPDIPAGYPAQRTGRRCRASGSPGSPDSERTVAIGLAGCVPSAAAQYPTSRLNSQGSAASGIALLTFNNIEADIPITKGGIVTASNGASFSVNTSLTVGVANKNTYRATAQKYKAALSFVGIDDQYAVEVSVTATSTGSGGNISSYGLTSTSISGVSASTV